MSSPTLAQALDSEFRQACKVILGGEVGSLKDFSSYLSEYVQPPKGFKSGSGADVYVSGEHYNPSARFMDFAEIDWKKKSAPLSINEVKDIDSIVEALGGQFVYSGNIVLGKSREVERSTNVTDGFFISDSNFVSKGEYISHSSFARNCKNLFGVHDSANSSFAMRGISIGGPRGTSRLFESFLITASSDIFYSGTMTGCQKCWFSYFQKGRKYLIGNLQLSAPEYSKIESHLLEQIRGELSRKKRTFSLFDVLQGRKKPVEKAKPVDPAGGCDPEKTRAEVEKAWKSTSSVVLGKELPDVEKYGAWLKKDVDFYDISTERSPATGQDVYVMKKYWKCAGMSGIFVGLEKEELAGRTLKKEEITGDMGEMVSNAARIAFLTFYYTENCTNLDAPLISADAVNCYKTIMPVITKNSAYSFWPRESTNIFGSALAFASNFCISTYHVQDVTRSFEVDTASSSSDIYFCHNVEGLSNAMFCFNSKSKRNAIGNAEYPQDKYLPLKKALLGQLSDELESNKNLRWSIYNIGAK